jgi:probable rRNA maturation factor
MTRRVQKKTLMNVELEIQRATTSTNTPDDEQFQLWVDAVPSELDHISKCTIRIVDEEEARRFNRDYRNRDYATNVLSFRAELPDNLPVEIRQCQLGDILICAPVVVRESLERQRPEADHWAHLTIHGVLHLLGHDHEQPDEAAVMESLEIEILRKLGVSDPYIDIT